MNITFGLKKLINFALCKVRPTNGQILMNSQIGGWISLLSKDKQVKTILEIGTWKGLGSTKLIQDALTSRPDSVQAYSLESNPLFHAEAKTNLGSDVEINLILGRIVSISQLDSAELSESELKWFEEDVANLAKVNNVLDSLPATLDFCILDGGEFSTYAEFKTLLPRLRNWLILDDTNVRKNRLVHGELLTNRDWILITAGDDRNGWAVWKKVN